MEALISAIPTLGFPIVACLAMAWFIYQIYKKSTEQNNKNMDQVQTRCKEREEKLYQELKENREIIGEAIGTIAKYAEKLETIQKDIHDIKSDMADIKAHQ